MAWQEIQKQAVNPVALIFFGPPILYITGMVLPLFIHLCSLGVSSVYFLLQLNGSVGTETTEGAVVDS